LVHLPVNWRHQLRQTRYFLGKGAGLNAINAANSMFQGVGAGDGATKCRRFHLYYRARIRNQLQSMPHNRSSSAINAGASDAVDNLTGFPNDHSILIGDSTSTGGLSNSIALGHCRNEHGNQSIHDRQFWTG